MTFNKLRKMKSVKWIFNPLMLWGAGLGLFIGMYAVEIQETWWHRGPGYVDEEKVSERQYKRDRYTGNGIMLCLGVALWIVIANVAKKEAVEKEVYEEYSRATDETWVAYHVALRKVVGADVFDAAAAEAKKDPDYQAAKAAERTKETDHYYASRAAKGEE